MTLTKECFVETKIVTTRHIYLTINMIIEVVSKWDAPKKGIT